MKNTFEKYKYEIVKQNGESLVVAGYSKDHIIGATIEDERHSWGEEDLEDFSYVLPQYKSNDGQKNKFKYIYISEELLRFKPKNDE